MPPESNRKPYGVLMFSGILKCHAGNKRIKKVKQKRKIQGRKYYSKDKILYF